MSRRQGFTLVEIMIVVAIIALLVSLAIPAFIQYRKDAQDALFTNQLRMMRDSFISYNIKSGIYPPDVGPGVVPAGMSNYFPHLDWSLPTPIGGAWDWDRSIAGVTAAVSVVAPERTTAEMVQIDEMFDDGDLGTGHFRVGTARYFYVIQ